MTTPISYGGGATGPMPFNYDPDTPDYDPDADYKRRDSVTHDGTLWMATSDVTGVTPDALADEWIILLEGVTQSDLDQISGDAANAVAAGAAVSSYPDTATGLAATSDGQYFWVPVGDYLQLHLNDSGVAVVQTGVLQPLKAVSDAQDARITALEIVTVDGLSVTPSAVQELGTSTTPDLSWVLGGTGTADSLTINDVAITVTDTDWTAAAPITATTVYTVEATYNGDQTHSDSVTVTFQNRAFWGKSASGTLDSAGIVALANSQVRGDKTLSGTTSLTAEYLFVAAPVAYGTAATWVIGAFSEAPVVATVSVTTAAGHTEDYYLFRSENLLSGNVDWSVS